MIAITSYYLTFCVITEVLQFEVLVVCRERETGEIKVGWMMVEKTFT